MKVRPGETLDSIIYPDLLILQKSAGGYRFGLDPILLTGLVRSRPEAPVLDLGSGSGIIAFILARRWPDLPITGLEIQADLHDRACRSAQLSRLAHQVRFVQGDLRRCASIFTAGLFNTILCNPPYRKVGTGRLPADPERAAARHGTFMTVPDLASGLNHLLSNAGDFFLAWKPERRQELEAELDLHGLRLTEILPVRSREVGDPFLLLCRGGRGRSPLNPTCLPPLSVYQGRTFSPQVDSLLRCGALP